MRHVCAAGGSGNRGCTVRYPNGRVEIYCAEGDYECLAHELRHVADPTWQHDLDYRSVSARSPRPTRRATQTTTAGDRVGCLLGPPSLGGLG